MKLSHWHSYRRRRLDRRAAVSRSQLGGAMVEFSIVFPVLFLVFAGVLGIGQALEQFAWTSQSAYQLYLAGAEYPTSAERAPRMNARWGTLQINYAREDSRARRLLNSAYANPAPPPAVADVVSAQVQGSLDTIIGTFSPHFLRNQIVGPVLSISSALAGSLSVPGNTAFYDCFGNRCPGIAPCGGACMTCDPSSSLCSCSSGSGPIQICQPIGP